MTGGPKRLRRRIRSAAIVFMIAAGTFSVLATTPARAEVMDKATGMPFLLSPDHPTVKVVYRFDATPQLFDDVTSFGVNVLHTEIWSGVEEPLPAIELHGRKLAGPSVSHWSYADGRCGASPRCVGTYEVTFSWPDGVRSGSVRVEWSVEARAGYDASEPPEGARVSVTIESTSGVDTAPHRFFDGSFALSDEDPIITTDIRIASEQPMPQHVGLALEIDPLALEGTGAAIVLFQRDLPPAVPDSGTATALRVPDRCARAACAFKVTLVTSLLPARTRFGRPLTWGLSSDVQLSGLSASATERSLLVLSRTVELNRLTIRGNDGWIAPVRIDVPAAALPRSEFAPVRPLLQGIIDVSPLEIAVVGGEFGTVTAWLTFPGAKPRFDRVAPSWYLNPSYTTDPSAFVVPFSCSAGRRCRIRASIEFEVMGNDGGMIELTPSFTVTLFYPRAALLPEGAGLDVSVGGEWTHVVPTTPAV